MLCVRESHATLHDSKGGFAAIGYYSIALWASTCQKRMNESSRILDGRRKHYFLNYTKKLTSQSIQQPRSSYDTATSYGHDHQCGEVPGC